MILGIGTDLIEVFRLEKLYQDHGKEKLLKIFSLEELNYCLQSVTRAQRLALRFAVKEACFKAFYQAGLGAYPYHNFSYVGNRVILKGAAQKYEHLKIHVSVAHTDNTASAFIVLEG